jgi:hypothetical protein
MFKRKSKKLQPPEIDWRLEYGLRMIHSSNAQGICKDCHVKQEECQTLILLNSFTMDWHDDPF